MEHNRHWSHAFFRLTKAAQTSHGLIILCGLAVGLCYLPAWSAYLFHRAVSGAVSWFLIATMIGFIGIDLWHRRKTIRGYSVSEEDRIIGHAFIISGILIYPFCRFALWSQAVIWLAVLLGIITSTWGLSFFWRHKLSTLFLCLTVYPRLGILSRTAWEFFFPPFALENLMARSASFALQGIGFPASAIGRFIEFPQGQVEVGWGCNGLDMAITIAIAGLFIGLILKQPFAEIAKFMAVGIFLAFIANIPRLMLVSVAFVYWGKGWFSFWHGFWGGQVFSTILFTLYYYLMTYFAKLDKSTT